jgi:hypothetical protein
MAGASAVEKSRTSHRNGGLAGREPLQGGDERELDRLSGLLALRRVERSVRGPVEPGVGVGLQPGDLAAPRRLGRLERRDGRRRRPSPAVADGVEAAVRGDAVEPGAKRRGAGEVVEARHAAAIVSCTRSSASVSDPSMR